MDYTPFKTKANTLIVLFYAKIECQSFSGILTENQFSLQCVKIQITNVQIFEFSIKLISILITYQYIDIN